MLHAQLYFYLFYIFRKWLHLTSVWGSIKFLFLFLFLFIRPFLLRCILGQTQTKIPDVIKCYFIVKCSGFVIHHINLSHVYGSATAEACPTSTRRVTKQSGFSMVNHFLTCCCDGCCQMTEYARNSNVQVSFMKLVALSNYRIKDKSLLNIKLN